VPTERVRVFKDVVTEQRTVTEDIRKEQIDLWTDLPGQPADPDSHRRH
jgi:stress response protein YsnF